MKIISYLIKLLLCIFKCFIIVAVLINVQITWVIPATKISTCIGAKWAPSNWRGSCSNFNRVGCHTPDSWFVSKFQLSPLSSLYCSLCQLQPKTHKTEKVKHRINHRNEFYCEACLDYLQMPKSSPQLIELWASAMARDSSEGFQWEPWICTGCNAAQDAIKWNLTTDKAWADSPHQELWEAGLGPKKSGA